MSTPGGPRGQDGRTLAPFGRRRALVVSTRTVGAYVLLELSDRGGPDADPGQFHMLATVSGWGADGGVPFLPRAAFPMGSNAGNLWFMLEDVGPGTHRLTTLKKGEPLWVLGPLGRGFRADPERRAILVSDGIGLPPIMAFTRTLASPPTLLLGFPSVLHAQVAASFAGAQLATADGTIGHHGSVVELLERELDRDPDAIVHASGPAATLEAVRALAVSRGVPAQLALQGPMACGFGACHGCAAPLAGGGYGRVCVDGPVMAADALGALG